MRTFDDSRFFSKMKPNGEISRFLSLGDVSNVADTGIIWYSLMNYKNRKFNTIMGAWH